MEEGCAKRLIEVGIRTMNAHQRKQADRFGVEVLEMWELTSLEKLKLAGPVYISFDIDVLDPAFAPGISHREPGGMSVRETISHLHTITGDLVGADVVEYNPKQDVLQIDGDGVRENPERDSGEAGCGMRSRKKILNRRLREGFAEYAEVTDLQACKKAPVRACGSDWRRFLFNYASPI
jgi:hypothetical protein